MNYGDFSSIVQLGVGLHIGTALLEFYGAIGTPRLARKLQRIERAIAISPIAGVKEAEKLEKLNRSFDRFKIVFENESKKFLKINTIAAIALTITLGIISYKAADGLHAALATFFCALSVGPASITLVILRMKARTALKNLKSDADSLETAVLKDPAAGHTV